MRILLGGDLDLPGWRCLVESGHRLKADVLIVPHHGAPGGASSAFGSSMSPNLPCGATSSTISGRCSCRHVKDMAPSIDGPG
jgi:hypothetical protein